MYGIIPLFGMLCIYGDNGEFAANISIYKRPQLNSPQFAPNLEIFRILFAPMPPIVRAPHFKPSRGIHHNKKKPVAVGEQTQVTQKPNRNGRPPCDGKYIYFTIFNSPDRSLAVNSSQRSCTPWLPFKMFV